MALRITFGLLAATCGYSAVLAGFVDTTLGERRREGGG